MLFGFVFVYWINNMAKMFHWRPDVIIIRESETVFSCSSLKTVEFQKENMWERRRTIWCAP